jgi:hypothetical protein
MDREVLARVLVEKGYYTWIILFLLAPHIIIILKLLLDFVQNNILGGSPNERRLFKLINTDIRFLITKTSDLNDNVARLTNKIELLADNLKISKIP